MIPSNTNITALAEASLLSPAPARTEETPDPILQALWSLLQKTVKKVDVEMSKGSFSKGLDYSRSARVLDILIKNRNIVLCAEPDSKRLIINREKQAITNSKIETNYPCKQSDDYMAYQDTIDQIVGKLFNYRDDIFSTDCSLFSSSIANDVEFIDLLAGLGAKIPNNYQEKLNETLVAVVDKHSREHDENYFDKIKALLAHGAGLTLELRVSINEAVRKSCTEGNFSKMSVFLSLLDTLGCESDFPYTEFYQKLSECLGGYFTFKDLNFVINKLVKSNHPLNYRIQFLKDIFESHHDYLSHSSTLSLVKKLLEEDALLKNEVSDYMTKKTLEYLDECLHSLDHFVNISDLLGRIARYKKVGLPMTSKIQNKLNHYLIFSIKNIEEYPLKACELGAKLTPRQLFLLVMKRINILQGHEKIGLNSQYSPQNKRSTLREIVVLLQVIRQDNKVKKLSNIAYETILNTLGQNGQVSHEMIEALPIPRLFKEKMEDMSYFHLLKLKLALAELFVFFQKNQSGQSYYDQWYGFKRELGKLNIPINGDFEKAVNKLPER